MSLGYVDDNCFKDIANAIRNKAGSITNYYPGDMADAINNISGGGGINPNDYFITYTNNGEVVGNPMILSLQSPFYYYGYNEAQVQLYINLPTVFTNELEWNDFNEPVTIGNQVTYCYQIFQNLPSFNQPVTIPNGATNCQSMFWNCASYNQDITIPASVTDARYMFDSCYNMGSNIFVDAEFESAMNCTAGMLASKDHSKRVNIWCNNLSTFLSTNWQSIVSSSITWTEMTNGYFNSVYNIYLYNNYSAETGVIT